MIEIDGRQTDKTNRLSGNTTVLQPIIGGKWEKGKRNFGKLEIEKTDTLENWELRKITTWEDVNFEKMKHLENSNFRK